MYVMEEDLNARRVFLRETVNNWLKPLRKNVYGKWYLLAPVKQQVVHYNKNGKLNTGSPLVWKAVNGIRVLVMAEKEADIPYIERQLPFPCDLVAWEGSEEVIEPISMFLGYPWTMLMAPRTVVSELEYISRGRRDLYIKYAKK